MDTDDTDTIRLVTSSISLTSLSSLSLVVVDDIAAFYWSKRAEKVRPSISDQSSSAWFAFLAKVIYLLKAILNAYRVPLIVTKPTLFKSTVSLTTSSSSSSSSSLDSDLMAFSLNHSYVPSLFSVLIITLASFFSQGLPWPRVDECGFVPIDSQATSTIPQVGNFSSNGSKAWCLLCTTFFWKSGWFLLFSSWLSSVFCSFSLPVVLFPNL
jgi:hypothetical protein